MSKTNIPILVYHSIELVTKSTVMRSLYVPPRRFNFQMRMLKILGYKGLSMKKLKPYLDGKKFGKVVGITFDDGYRNNLTNAAPILKKYGFSATCYLVTQRIGSSNKWDLDKGITKLPLMTHSEIQEWLDFGMDIGSHTQTHADLTRVSKEKAEKEIKKCKSDLENKFNISIDDFCYPFGRFNESIYNLTKNAGYKTATTMMRGRANLESNQFKLQRIPITFHTLPHLFFTKILTNYEDKR